MTTRGEWPVRSCFRPGRGDRLLACKSVVSPVAHPNFLPVVVSSSSGTPTGPKIVKRPLLQRRSWRSTGASLRLHQAPNFVLRRAINGLMSAEGGS
jgi:hypothetical protein